jgi:hypothetical protein
MPNATEHEERGNHERSVDTSGLLALNIGIVGLFQPVEARRASAPMPAGPPSVPSRS